MQLASHRSEVNHSPIFMAETAASSPEPSFAATRPVFTQTQFVSGTITTHCKLVATPPVNDRVGCGDGAVLCVNRPAPSGTGPVPRVTSGTRSGSQFLLRATDGTCSGTDGVALESDSARLATDRATSGTGCASRRTNTATLGTDTFRRRTGKTGEGARFRSKRGQFHRGNR